MLNSEFVADLFVYIFPSASIFGASGEEESVRFGGYVLRWVRLEPSPRSRGGASVLLEGGGSFSPPPNSLPLWVEPRFHYLCWIHLWIPQVSILCVQN